MDDSAQKSGQISDDLDNQQAMPSDSPVGTPSDDSQTGVASQPVVDQSATQTPPTPVPPVSQPSSDATTQPTQPVAGPRKEIPPPFTSPLGEQVPHFSDQVLENHVHDTTDADKIAKEEGDEYWEAFAKEIELEKEIEELGGIEKVESGEVQLPEDVAKEMGINPTVTIDTPIQQVTDFSVGNVSLSDDQISLGMKKPMSTGFRWLAEWFIFQLLKAHYHLKKVGGKIVRMKPPK